MLENEYRDLVSQLHERTAKGTVNWLPTSDEKLFLVQFKGFSFSIRQFYEDESTGYEFTLRDSKGKTIDNFFVSDMSGLHLKASELFSAARRRALKIDEALESILSEIRDSEVVGQVPSPPAADDDDSIPF